MKKILSTLLAVVMMITGVCMFASCDAVSAVTAIAQADQALENNPYCVTITMDLRCDNAQINEVLKTMNMKIPVTVNGKDLAMSVTTEVYGISATANMTIVDKVLYYDMAVPLLGQNMKMRTALTEMQYEDFFKDSGSKMPVDSTQFQSLSLQSSGGKHVISCSGITSDGLSSMNELLSDALSIIGASVSVGDLAFAMTISGGKYESMDLSAVYTVTVGGQTHVVNMKMTSNYAYDNIQPVTKPADASSYKDVSYGDIMG